MDTNLTIEQVFVEILSGRMDTSDFEQWVYYQRAEAADVGYKHGYDTALVDSYDYDED